MSLDASGDRLDHIVGVRKHRGDAVVFADANALTLAPLDLVIVRFSDADTALALVVVGSGQIVEDEVGLEPFATVVRLATSDETSRFNAASDNAVVDAGLPQGWDSWIEEPGLSRAQDPAGETGEVTSAAELIKRLFPNPSAPRAPRRHDQSR